jgi:hypothetical protein
MRWALRVTSMVALRLPRLGRGAAMQEIRSAAAYATTRATVLSCDGLLGASHLAGASGAMPGPSSMTSTRSSDRSCPRRFTGPAPQPCAIHDETPGSPELLPGDDRDRHAGRGSHAAQFAMAQRDTAQRATGELDRPSNRGHGMREQGLRVVSGVADRADTVTQTETPRLRRNGTGRGSAAPKRDPRGGSRGITLPTTPSIISSL